MTVIPHCNRISIRDFLARRGIQPKYERNGYGMYLSLCVKSVHRVSKWTMCKISGTTSDWERAARCAPS